MFAKKDIIIFGIGRSGTTWLAELIAATGLDLIFEPLYGKEVPRAKEWNTRKLYMTRKTDDPLGLQIAKELFSGKVRNKWIDNENVGAKRRVIKEIRANLMMDWILHNFKLQPVFMIRNPLAVVGSMKKHGWGQDTTYIERIFNNKNLYNDHLKGFEDIRDQEHDRITRMTVLWAINNYVPKHQGYFKKTHFLRYEDLVRDTNETVTKLFRKLGLKVTDKVKERFREHSFMAGVNNPDDYNPLRAWQKHLTEVEVEKVVKIVKRFGLEEYMEL